MDSTNRRDGKEKRRRRAFGSRDSCFSTSSLHNLPSLCLVIEKKTITIKRGKKSTRDVVLINRSSLATTEFIYYFKDAFCVFWKSVKKRKRENRNNNKGRVATFSPLAPNSSRLDLSLSLHSDARPYMCVCGSMWIKEGTVSASLT